MTDYTTTLVDTVFPKYSKLLSESSKVVETVILAQLDNFTKQTDDPKMDNRCPPDAFQSYANFVKESKNQDKKGTRLYKVSGKETYTTDDGKTKTRSNKDLPKVLECKNLRKPASLNPVCKKSLLYVLSSIINEVKQFVESDDYDSKLSQDEFVDQLINVSDTLENPGIINIVCNITKLMDKTAMDSRVKKGRYSVLSSVIRNIVEPLFETNNSVTDIIIDLYCNFILTFASKIANMIWHTAFKEPVASLTEEKDPDMQWNSKSHTMSDSYLREFMGIFDQLIGTTSSSQSDYMASMDEFLEIYDEKIVEKKAQNLLAREAKNKDKANKKKKTDAKSKASAKVAAALEDADNAVSDEEDDDDEDEDEPVPVAKPRKSRRGKRSL